MPMAAIAMGSHSDMWDINNIGNIAAMDMTRGRKVL
jgi:hypothetical protein